MMDAEQTSSEKHELPKKGILKKSADSELEARPSRSDTEGKTQNKNEVKWDEQNILETFHPANKDYGHMKIDEPPTPYDSGSESGDEFFSQDSSDKNIKLNILDEAIKKIESEETRQDIPATKKRHRSSFEAKRAQHYDEGRKIKELMVRKKKNEQNPDPKE